jgi:pyruvate/oxaloacetate carboxyltransferase
MKLVIEFKLCDDTQGFFKCAVRSALEDAIKENKLMATFADIQTGVDELGTVISSMAGKLDDIQSLVSELSAGSPVTQDQLDALSAKVEEVKQIASNDLARADDLA